MKKILIVLTATLLFTLSAHGQNLFFIGENSYLCTETMTLKSNSDDASNLDVLLAKDGNKGLFVVSAESYFGAIFSNEIIIYLQDGTVIKCNDRVTYDYVDSRAKAVYPLTSDQLNSMKNSNIHTVRYTLEVASDDDNLLNMEWNWSASNKGIPTKTIVTYFLEGKINDTVEYRGVAGGEGNQGVETGSVNSDNHSLGISGLGDKGISYSLEGRTPQLLPKPEYNFQAEGIVVVEVTVNQYGNVTKATAGVKGSTTLDSNLLKAAQKAALAAKFDRKPSAAAFQKGTITYHFILR